MSNAWGSRGGGRGRGDSGGNRNYGDSGGAYPPLGGSGGQRGPSGTNSVTSNMRNMNIANSGGHRGSRPSGPATGPTSRNQSEGAIGGENGNREGRPGVRRGRTFADKVDVLNTRGDNRPSKRGRGGRQIALVANFFRMRTKPSWNLYNHRVEFRNANAKDGGLEEERTWIKKKLLSQVKDKLGLHIFDGSNLYTINRLHPDPMHLTTQRKDGTAFELSITFVAEVGPFEATYLQFFNIIMRRCLELLDFAQIGRHYYDHGAEIKLDREGIILIPGFITTIRQYEEGLMMCVEITHKVLRTASCWELIQKYQNSRDGRARVEEILVSAVVMTRYNNKTYHIDDINWSIDPSQMFEHKGSKISLADYYQKKYQITLTNLRQPILVSNPRKQDLHRGDAKPIYLIPELCFPTGLLDSDRQNIAKMRVLAGYLQQNPTRRAANTIRFMGRLRESVKTRDELAQWGLNFEGQALVSINEGRVLSSERLEFREDGRAGYQPISISEKAEWNNVLRNDTRTQMAIAPQLRGPCWVIITPQEIAPNVPNLVRMMINVGRGMGFPVAQPAEILALPNPRLPTYVSAIDRVKNTHRELKLIFTIMPPPSMMRDTTAVYNVIKKICLTPGTGILNQCFRQPIDSGNNKLMSIVSKLMVQINAKLGGEPWRTSINDILSAPTMIVGFDVHHPGKMRSSGKNSYGAMVATMNKGVSQFFSTVSPHESMVEIGKNFQVDIIKCVRAFGERNPSGFLPANIIFYRDGVGEGQLKVVYDSELTQIKKALKQYYESIGKAPPKLLFIVVTKRGNARILSKLGNDYGNPPPGTVVDDTITLPERYDFFLVAQEARNGQTVSPTAYNVIHDEILKSPAEVQALTFRMCHMYYNWSGTVAVPAVCQYAHKLAYLTGTALDTTGTDGTESIVAPNLQNYLYYL